MTTTQFGPFIAGRRVVGSGPERTVLDPATQQQVAVVVEASPDDVNAAVDAATAAFSSSAKASGAQRARVLHGLADVVDRHTEELALLLTAEQGKPLKESRLELDRFGLNLRYYAGLAQLPDGEVVSRIAPGVRGEVLRSPIGVCAAIVPWNFPIGLLGNKIGPALAAGNSLIIKPAETTPLVTLRLAELWAAAVEPGTINVVPGGRAVGEQLVDHRDIAKIAFTGSTATGQAIAQRAAGTLKRLTLELGGSDPMIVLPDADTTAAARGVATSRFFNCGQVCVATKRVFVVGPEAYEAFVRSLADRVERLRVGDGRDDVSIGPLHSRAVLERFEEHRRDALESGRVVATAPAPEGVGNFAAPTVVADVDPTSRVFTEEVFGPLLPVVRVASIDEALELANSADFALGGTVWGADVHRARAVAEALRCGYAWVNSTQRVHRELPFGGLGLSGVGREHGVEAFESYTDSRTFIYPAPDFYARFDSCP